MFLTKRSAALMAAALALVLAALAAWTEQGRAAANYAWIKLHGGYSVGERLDMHASAVEARLQPQFRAAGVAYPPTQLAYVAFKDTAQLQVYARTDAAAPWSFVHTYPILGMSGKPGPKLQQGDRQVPEGIYRAAFLNANSRFHLSIQLNYPNEFDQAQAKADGRDDLGSDIMIHGSTASIGCLAMGDQTAEDLFILAALSGKENVEIVVAPTDFRLGHAQAAQGSPAWLATLHEQIQAALGRFPSPTPSAVQGGSLHP